MLYSLIIAVVISRAEASECSFSSVCDRWHVRGSPLKANLYANLGEADPDSFDGVFL